MQVKWLIDGEGPSPTFAEDGLTVRIPAGTIEGEGAKIGNADCWHLCFPDNSGDYKRGNPGLIHCEPYDDECRAQVDKILRGMSATARRWFDLALKRTAVVRKEQQAEEARKVKAGEPLMPIHPDLLLAPEGGSPPSGE